MKGFNDIEGTEICEGDEILFTNAPYGSSASDLCRGKVTGFTPRFMKFSSSDHGWTEKIMDDGCPDRVLVMKGEFKTYTKTEIQDHAS
tara:strand:- start:702 stop:965 length:264 start_codon:yes stop_codon:yes gene_type:complete